MRKSSKRSLSGKYDMEEPSESKFFPDGGCGVFKGLDWTELEDYFGLNRADPVDVCFDSISETEPLAEFLKRNCVYPASKRIVEPCRSFLRALSSVRQTHDYPVWRGLLDVEDDVMFMVLFIRLLPYMWV